MTAGLAFAARLRQVRWRITRSIKLRMVLVFLLLAAALTLVFVVGAQRAFSVGWREAARPLLTDYVDRLSADIAANGHPSVARAQALVERLPLTVRISGPSINWSSHPDQASLKWVRSRKDVDTGGDGPDWAHLLQRTTADGHTLVFGIDAETFERRPHRLGYVLAALLLLTFMAWLYIRHLLKPLDAIGAGARRFGAGDFSEPIPARYVDSSGELGELAATLNTMGRDIHQMLEAKRALLLAISHELRSPLTRARLNTELLPESADVRPQRDALLRDLQEMAMLISDLLESERLAGQHAALQRESTDLPAMALAVVQELAVRHAAAGQVRIQADADLPRLELDPNRMRLLLRNLLDNALRHGAAAHQPPEVRLQRTSDSGIAIEVRDYGPGVPDSQLRQLAQAFYRPDSARTRAAGGVGLGLYLCRLIAQAHGGAFEVRNAKPGLSVLVTLPA
ncbi:MAG: HAMP domain-containing protein [Burkholderiaceae bacterium]|nr:HAMP domain-containing protein [Burkholderiaceae bacterium]